jgi:predicted ATPase
LAERTGVSLHSGCGALDRWLLIEREHERQAIDAAVAGIDEGTGVLLLIDGPPGIGKSALLHELIERAHAGHVRVLSARATPIEQDVAFGVALQLFAPVVKGVSTAERERLLSGPAALAESLLSGGKTRGPGRFRACGG